MKPMVVLALLAMVAWVALAASPSTKADASFCADYRTGYARGWCTGDLECTKPAPPACPAISQDSQQSGFDRGYRDGQQARR